MSPADLLHGTFPESQQICSSFSGLLIIIISLIICLLKKYTSGPSFDTSPFDLTGKYAVITGGNSGIGKQTFLQLIRLNCNVIIGARDRQNSEKAVKLAQKIILAHSPKKTTIVQHYYLNLASKKSIQQFSTIIHQRFPKIDYLVNNAGISMIPKKTLTQDGFEMMFGVNHLGHFYLTSLLMDLLQKSQFFRIINVSSKAHKQLLGFGPSFSIDWENLNFTTQSSYEHKLAYSRSKLCNVLFTKGLAKRIMKTKGISASLNPGIVQSQILRYQYFLKILTKIMTPLCWLFMKNNKEGAQTTLYALLEKSIETGQYYSDCKKDRVNEFAQNEKNIERLWDISESLLGIRFEIQK